MVVWDAIIFVCPMRCCSFQEAWVNFIALEQHQYEEAFRCRCPQGCKAVIADGIVLGTNRNKVCTKIGVVMVHTLIA